MGCTRPLVRFADGEITTLKKYLLAGNVTFKSEGETLDLSAFLGEAAEDEESESVEAASAAAAVADELAADKDAE